MKNSKCIDNSEEMKKKNKEILIEINKIDNEIKKQKKQKLFKLVIIILLIIIIIKLFFGTIEIYNIFGYPSNRTRFYKVTINNELNTVNYNLKHKIPIIPFLINFNSIYQGGNQIVKDLDDVYFYENNSEKYIIDISSYSCFYNNYQVDCRESTQKMIKNDDTKYTNLKIIRTSNPYEELYNGKFITDITPYVIEKGVYYVGITAKYSLVETEVFFYFKR